MRFDETHGLRGFGCSGVRLLFRYATIILLNENCGIFEGRGFRAGCFALLIGAIDSILMANIVNDFSKMHYYMLWDTIRR